MATFDERIKRLEREIDESQRTTETKIEAKLTALEQRLKATPGKLPVARSWKPETVVYQSEFVSCEGALWQACKDTATKPGSADWICVARAGRDAITPAVRGTYDVREKYQQLDIVAMDGGTFIAKRDDPGVCPGDGWQLLAKQGRVGRPGRPAGSKGERGEKGPATMPKLVETKIDETYRLSILREDGSLEIIPLREAFERFFNETSAYDG
jgi:hypothetical protein